MEAPAQEQKVTESLYRRLGGYDTDTFAEDADLTLKILADGWRIEYEPRHTADVASTWADVGKAARILGWKAQVPAREGLRRTVEWYRGNRDWAANIDTA